ncbi:tRNA (adenosine(37)-N6)-threonylcarbamoyltransferase complex dimerization subunit type 1 TsaB [Altererythrobacter sp. BO-6]|uniref:tRNA (adenosine(37)-N6)-threonylcarbamoyltransferase complex dimerization subunit type 1 TsaB n=1 Tax=Altererythrobacter sp. BO-6 TaxID=2604537 RepID=UPI0013E14E8F|nr:tRNA (adenosine(37)-N6)-threonylcarbamoyltransferase complex dimerization subunit type 1 TsaB [Altererythrobacter sp. BO-6]QIG55058.1 tRNA (adenosine(37)-N6)-threonylcarbamoyltransferase complex dimerization subunit type 1 TsaB [Altererythrobacter sp. BO-6]
MRTLAIETATEACSIALFESGELVGSDHRVLGRGHAEQLVPMIAALPEKGRAERILVSLGPGSFTGVRIGIATTRALGLAWKADVLGYPTLALVAAMAQHKHPGTAVTVCMNGGHGEWFVQDFGPGVEAQSEARSLTPDAASTAGTASLIAGNRARELADRSGCAPVALEILPDARMVHLLSDQHLTSALTPIYGRGPDAKLPDGKQAG